MSQDVSVRISSESISPAEILAGMASEEHGGECSFVGRVRAHNVGRQVKGIAYDVHEVLAVKSIERIVQEARERWELDAHVRVVHRQGHLHVGESSVVVAVTTRHRDEAFRICRYVIDELKHRTPIWKKEYYSDGESQWVQGHALCQHRQDA